MFTIRTQQDSICAQRRRYKPVSQSCAVAKSEKFWRATGQINLAYKRLANVWFSYSHNCTSASGAGFHSLSEVWVSSGPPEFFNFIYYAWLWNCLTGAKCGASYHTRLHFRTLWQVSPGWFHWYITRYLYGTRQIRRLKHERQVRHLILWLGWQWRLDTHICGQLRLVARTRRCELLQVRFKTAVVVALGPVVCWRLLSLVGLQTRILLLFQYSFSFVTTKKTVLVSDWFPAVINTSTDAGWCEPSTLALSFARLPI